ncbi:hypothetical protein [Curtobacterium aurantiacum]|uniref:hypothetical protein n=1 Tax=Curtobacterium aurantiacum TaxID=3236919 RepID=UPI001BDF65D7|nr:hypothetical protein [Curtobacterium flaccumfaciens]MBT1678940.1 hypothetical protein [Curtobacterium flaccumfaciens pv. flaccumfaciens]
MILIGVPLAFVGINSNGKRPTARQTEQWIRDRYVPDDVPERQWRPALERYRERLGVAWPWALIAAIQIVNVGPFLNQLDEHKGQGYVILAVFMSALATWALVRWFRLRPVLRDLIKETSQRFWERERRRADDPSPVRDV